MSALESRLEPIYNLRNQLMLPKEIVRCGTDQPGTEPVPLRAGPLTLLFEPDSAMLRHVRLGDHEVVRGIYGAVRDAHWNTLPRDVTRLEVEQEPDGFRLRCHVESREGDIDFAWNVRIEGNSEGKIVYEFDGEARSTFQRNRIGLCLLHPVLECTAKPCEIESTDGTTVEGTFPGAISPHQPFKNIRAIRNEPAPGQRVEVRLEGEVFEMEDQRNWTDASYKTYSTPLERPLPVQVTPGTRVQQTVTVSLLEPRRKILPILQGRGAQISIATTPVLPQVPLGLCLAAGASTLSQKELERLKRLHLNHLRIDLDLATPDFSLLESAAGVVSTIEASLHVALILGDDPESEMATLSAALSRIQPRVNLWLLFHRSEVVTDEKWVGLAWETLKAAAPNALIAAGTREWFTELNRNRPGPTSSALPCYTLNPQCHAFDETSLVENLAAQVDTVETARTFSARPVVISPITLRPRATPDSAPGALPPDVDARQMSLFGAGWTLGSLSRLMSCGNVHSLTYYEVTGGRGIMETAQGSPIPDRFHSIPGSVFPVYHVLAALAGFDRLYPTHSSHPLQVEAMTLLDTRGRRRILVANLLGKPQQVRIKTGTCQAQVKHLDETNANTAMTDPETYRAEPGAVLESKSGKIELNLAPYGLAQLDIL